MSELRTGNFFNDLKKYLDYPEVVIITDENVFKFYGEKFPDLPLIVLKSGEERKSLETVEKIYKKFLKFKVSRSTFIVGIGGGVVCDITGFAASTYLRGLNFGFFPTTLLAQADAAMGGKNGVNFSGYKNMVGSIVQPEFVYSDISVLKTLPPDELKNGFAEIIKHGLIRDIDLIEFMEGNKDKIINLEGKSVEYILDRSKEIKMKIVQTDEKESGERRILNFGHTFGHAFEEILSIPHGEAVSVGMVWAAKFSNSEKMLSSDEVEKINKLLIKFGLPVSVAVDAREVRSFFVADKKRDSDRINFVFLDRVGNSVVKEIPLKKVEDFTNAMCKSG